MKRALEAAGGYQGLEDVEKEEYRDWVEMGCVGEEVAQAAHLVWLGGEGAAECEQAEVLSVTLFRRGFLGLFLVDRGSICHIDPSSSESRAGAVRLEGQGGATVIAMITGVVVKMDWPAHPTPGSAGGG